MKVQETQLWKDVQTLWATKRFHDAQHLLDSIATPAEARRVRARSLIPNVDDAYEQGYARGYHDAREDEA